MADRTDFLAEIISNPADDNVRLVYADWLQENGEEERAEFIRLQIEKARLPKPEYKCIRSPFADDPADYPAGICVKCSETRPIKCAYHQSEVREQELLEKDHEPILGYRTHFSGGHARHEPYGWIGVAGFAMDSCLFTRGFVSEVSCSAQTWLRVHNQIFWNPVSGTPCPDTAHPLERVYIERGLSVIHYPHLRFYKRREENPQKPWELRPWLSDAWPGLSFRLNLQSGNVYGMENWPYEGVIGLVGANQAVAAIAVAAIEAHTTS